MTFLIILLIPAILVIKRFFGVWPYDYRWLLVCYVFFAIYMSAEFLMNAISVYQGVDLLSFGSIVLIVCLLPLPVTLAFMAYNEAQLQRPSKILMAMHWLSWSLYSLLHTMKFYPWNLLFVALPALMGVLMYRKWEQVEKTWKEQDAL